MFSPSTNTRRQNKHSISTCSASALRRPGDLGEDCSDISSFSSYSTSQESLMVIIEGIEVTPRQALRFFCSDGVVGCRVGTYSKPTCSAFEFMGAAHSCVSGVTCMVGNRRVLKSFNTFAVSTRITVSAIPTLFSAAVVTSCRYKCCK